MLEVTDRQAELIQLWVKRREDPSAFDECAKQAGYEYRPGTYRKLKSRLLGLKHFNEALQRCREGKHPQRSKDTLDINLRIKREEEELISGMLRSVKVETITKQVDHLKANKAPDSEWVLSEALRLYTLALAEEKIPLAKSLLEIIAKHKKVDAFATTSNTTVNVFTDKAETLLIQGRKRLQSLPGSQDKSTPPPPRNRAMPPPEGNPPSPVQGKNGVSHSENQPVPPPECNEVLPGIANSEKKIHSDSGVTDGEWEEVI